MGLLDRIRPHPGFKDPDPIVRRAAVRTLDDPAQLSELSRNDPDSDVRDQAAEALLTLALRGETAERALQAVASLTDAKQLVAVARSAQLEAVSRAALARLDDRKALGSVARHGEHGAVRLEALMRLSDPSELQAVALKSPHREVALRALEQLSLSTEELNAVAAHARSPAAARRARVILHERSGAAGAPAHPNTDRPRQTRWCESVESLAPSTECESLQESLTAAKEAWTDLLPNVDDDLHERFTAASEAARARLRRNQAERLERERSETEQRSLHEQHLAPRLALCEMVETAEGAETPRRLEDARWEWERLPPVDAAEAAIREQAGDLALRFVRVCAAAQERHAAWEKSVAEAGQKAERARETAEREGRQAGNLSRLTKLADRLERLLKSEPIPLKKAEPGLREVRAALEEMPALPSRREHHVMVDRLKALQSALQPRVAELRESASWERWANANVQEELCGAVEALREVADPVAAARRLRDLQARWKTASVVSRDKSQALWQRFQAGAEEVRARLAAHRQIEEQAAAVSRERKEALCQQAEALGDSTDWIKTSAAIKALQADWKTIGAATRGHEKALWERFRKTCDRFFKRRDEDLSARKETWARNLAAQEALCVQAEALADSTDWRNAAETIKRLQIEWKTVGSVRRSQSEKSWRRFRTACDRFFERFKRRDQIEVETQAAAREALCLELEALLPSDDPTLLTRVQEIRKRWLAAPGLPSEIAAPLVERFQGALGRVIEGRPDLVKGTELDAEANRAALEELCLRVEKLLAPDPAADDAGLSPAARLALRWREAMATNTIGGKAAEETRWRGLSDEMKKAQEAWQRTGFVPEPIRRPLAERFERACRRFNDERPKSRPEPSQRASAPSRRR